MFSVPKGGVSRRMKQFFKVHYKKITVLSLDVLCLLAALICRPLSASMLESGSECYWSLMGIRCFTCGGTHFVNDLLSFRIGAAFADNQLLFIMTAYLGASLILFNLLWLFELGFAKKVLKVMYSIPALILMGVGMITFFVWRNWALIMRILRLLVAIVLHLVSGEPIEIP